MLLAVGMALMSPPTRAFQLPLPTCLCAARLHSAGLRRCSAFPPSLCLRRRNVFSALHSSGAADRLPQGSKVLTVTTWNVNSIRQRLPNVKRYIEEHRPDVLAVQEIKCQESDFPLADIQQLGYHYVAVSGQKSYNGVALISRHPISNLQIGLAGADSDPLEPQARYIQGVVCGVTICNVYVPNGNPVDSDKFEYRQRFMARLIEHVSFLSGKYEPFLVLGDFNTVPHDDDCYDAAAMRADAVMHLSSRKQFRHLSYLLGLYNAIDLAGAGVAGVAGVAPQSRQRHGGVSDAGERTYTYWDYRAGCWEKGNGLRIDHILLHPLLADTLQGAGVHTMTRGWTTPSDHAPVWACLRLVN